MKVTSLREAVALAMEGKKTSLKCPAHDDSNPSLSVGPGATQPVVMSCLAGCSTQAILDAESMTWADISLDEPRVKEDRWTPAGEANAIYPYVSASGQLLYEVLRVEEKGQKRFMQRQPDLNANGGYRWNLDGVDRVLYQLPQVLKAIQSGGTAHVAEGEKCVHALNSVIPASDVATTNSGGAGRFLPEFAEVLAGANVIVYADSDDPGREHARQVRDMLTAQGCIVRILEALPGRLPNGKPITDVADHIAAGRPLSTLLETTPGSTSERARSAVDWTDILDREDHEFEFIIPNVLARSERLLLVGPEGQGKSLWCRQISAAVASGLHPFLLTPMEPKRVLYIDAENHPGQVVASWKLLHQRITAHGGHPQPGMLNILEEWDSTIDLTSPKGRAWLKERVHAYQPDLMVLGPLKNLVQRNLSDHETVNQLRTTINMARSISECGVIMEHHAPLRAGGDKEREMRPYGSGLFLGWPDFGYAIKPTRDQGLYEWQQFRGDRVRGRAWPEAFRWGKGVEMPWEATILPNES